MQDLCLLVDVCGMTDFGRTVEKDANVSVAHILPQDKHLASSGVAELAARYRFMNPLLTFQKREMSPRVSRKHRLSASTLTLTIQSRTTDSGTKAVKTEPVGREMDDLHPPASDAVKGGYSHLEI